MSWSVAEHEPPIEDHAARAAGAAKNAEVHNYSAMGAAGQARDAATEVARHAQAAMEQIDAMRQQAETYAAQAQQAAQHAATVAQHMQGVVEMQQNMLKAFQTIAEALTAPRRLSVTKRGDDGAISEIVSGAM